MDGRDRLMAEHGQTMLMGETAFDNIRLSRRSSG